MGKAETTKNEQEQATEEVVVQKVAKNQPKAEQKIAVVDESEAKSEKPKAEKAKKPKEPKVAEEKSAEDKKDQPAKKSTTQKTAAAKTTKAPTKVPVKTASTKVASKTAPKTGKTMKINVVDLDEKPRPRMRAAADLGTKKMLTDVKPGKQPTKQKTKGKEETDMKLPKVRRVHFKISYVIGTVIVILLCVFFGRVAIWEQDYLNRMEGSERDVTSLDIEGEEDHDEVEPTVDEVDDYHVAAGMPRFFSIPSVDINNRRVVEVGLLAGNRLGTPYNVWNIGWYRGSAKPGDQGVSVIDAHGGRHGVAAFGNLPEVKIGDLVYVEMEPEAGETKGKIHTYQIVDTATRALGAEADDYMATMAFSAPGDASASMTLITCTGVYYQASRTYSHRFFARAILIDDQATEE